MADKPTAMEQMVMGFFSRMIGMPPDKLREVVTGIGGGIQSAAKDLAELKAAAARIEARLERLDARDKLLANGRAAEGAGGDLGAGTENHRA